MPTEQSAERVRYQRKVQVALGYRLLSALGWGEFTDGHISARDPERTDCFWILRYPVPFHRARVSDLILIGPDGEVVEGNDAFNNSAYYIHAPILEARPDIVCATHCHTSWGTPFAAEVRAFEPITQESCIFFEDHAIFDDEEVDIQDRNGGERIAAALEGNRGIILRNHGLLTVGPRVDDAVGAFVAMERVAEAHMKARNAIPISAGPANAAKKNLVENGLRYIFDNLVSRYIPDPSAVRE